MSSNPFIGMSASTLNTLRAKCLAKMETLMSKPQSYTINGKSASEESMDVYARRLGQIDAALQIANGETTDTTFISFTGL